MAEILPEILGPVVEDGAAEGEATLGAESEGGIFGRVRGLFGSGARTTAGAESHENHPHVDVAPPDPIATVSHTLNPFQFQRH